jgi:hypothetical protein
LAKYGGCGAAPLIEGKHGKFGRFFSKIWPYRFHRTRKKWELIFASNSSGR